MNSILGRPVDRFFRYEHGPWPSTRQRWLGEGFPPGCEFGEYFQMDPIERLRLNSGYCDSPYHPKFVERTIEETATYRVFVASKISQSNFIAVDPEEPQKVEA
ncbi:MAG: hypothetical protein HY360_24920 [Verrucomicrobia bacterium]|nr:hypothetical protein [Verrucomicrobiota bacterium]